jgi:peptidyl-prolyl cis-trans isomerase B (cyclophilin B)
VLKKFIFFLSIITFMSCSEQISDLYEIQKLEFSRTSVPGIFDKYISNENPQIRNQAAISMGRIQDTIYLPELKKLTGDTDTEVVESAIFSIGQMGNTKSRSFLLNLFEKPSFKEQKINILRSIGRIKGEETVDVFLNMLPELEDSLCAEAIMGISFQTSKKREKNIGKIIAPFIENENPKIQQAAMYYYSRHPYSRVAKLLIENPCENNSLANKYRLKALDKSVTKYQLSVWDTIMVDSLQNDLIWQLNDRKISWQHKYYQLSILAQFDDSLTVKALVKGIDDPNPHLRKQTILCLGKQKSPDIKNILLNYYGKATWAEKGEILIIIAGLDRHLAYRLIQQNLDQGSLYFKQLLLKALAKIKDSASIRQLRQFLIVPNTRLNLTAFLELDNLKRMSYKYVKPFLESGDLVMTTIAASWIAENPKDGQLNDLISAYSKFSEPDGVEPMQAILSAIEKLNLTESHSFIEQAYLDAQCAALVNQISEIMDKFGMKKKPRPDAPIKLFVPDTLIDRNDEIEVLVKTERGDILIELQPAIAPATVSNFIYLVKKKYYNNIAFHRVVSDFVIQAGDPQGTGWGGPGYSIPCEYGPTPFLRGTVGMATAGKDTGGSQFFICHSEQPHLNGRYTVFGKVISGMEVVDQIQIDDKIQQIIIQN